MNEEQLQILRHMLGIDTPEVGKPKPYRNYYCANIGDSRLKELERIGMVKLTRTEKYYEYYETTDDGFAAAMRSHKAIRHSKPRRTYFAFLRISDVCPDLTFKEFITSREYKDVRADA